MFQSIEEVGEKLAEQSYVSDRRLATAVFLATRLNKPILVEGPAGVGKTELAKSLAGEAGQPLIRLQCYEGLDEAKALYEWEYSKQLLYTQVLREKIGETLAPTETLREAAEVLRGLEDIFFSENSLEEIAQHARQVVWITPEPRWGWNLGSCDMPLYEPVCNRVEVVRDVDGLANVAENLIKVRT